MCLAGVEIGTECERTAWSTARATRARSRAARCFSSCAAIGSACVIPIKCHMPLRSRTKVWSLMYHGSDSPTDGSYTRS